MFELDAISFQPRLEPNGLREVKERSTNYLSQNLVSEMYDLLMYSGDLRFSSMAAEMIYNLTKLDGTDFVNWCAAYYFANRKN